eukprot:3135682-Prymnesium_polylepis.1
MATRRWVHSALAMLSPEKPRRSWHRRGCGAMAKGRREEQRAAARGRAAYTAAPAKVGMQQRNCHWSRMWGTPRWPQAQAAGALWGACGTIVVLNGARPGVAPWRARSGALGGAEASTAESSVHGSYHRLAGPRAPFAQAATAEAVRAPHQSPARAEQESLSG